MKMLFPGLVSVLGLVVGADSEALAQGYGGWGMGPGMMGWGYGMGWLWMIIMIVFWVAVIVGIILLIRWIILSMKSTSQHGIQEESALDILKKRYARGEIDREEFEQRKKDLLS